MKLLTAAQMKQMDSYAINTLGIPSTLLMERAAKGVADAAERFLPETGAAVILCGSGNNGGDGVAAARFLIKRGHSVHCFLVGKREKMSADCAEMERRLNEYGSSLIDYPGLSGDFKALTAGSDVIIDALFGTGLNSDLRPDTAELVEFINSLPVPVVSADIPSGVHTDSGFIMRKAVNADITVTFTSLKPGLCLTPGSVCAGETVIHDIGIPHEVFESAESAVFSVDADFSDRVIPHRKRDSHKGDYGKVLIISGSTGYTGAPVLAARAAVRSGAGLVFLGVRPEVYPITAARLSSPVVFPAEKSEDIAKRLESCTACLIGCGLGTDETAEDLLYSVIRNSRVPLVIDADGISLVARNIDILDEAVCPVILTPHDGEFARLGGDLTSSDRLTAARDFAKAHNCVLVLKGYRTVTAFPDGRAYINLSGNPGMAKGGSGDVLAGVIVSLLGQLRDVEKAVPAAVYLHGAAGDTAAGKLGEYGMAPDDIVDALPLVLKKF